MNKAATQLTPINPDAVKPTIEARIKASALKLGFEIVGITTAEPSAFAAEYRDWIANGYSGEMEYLARNLERSIDPRQLLPGARSIIVVGMNYYTREEQTGRREDGETGRDDEVSGGGGDRETGRGETLRPTPYAPRPDVAVFARYARGDDYHDVMTARLKVLLGYVKSEAGPDSDGRVYVDTGPILEREVARRAGLGWFGKNTMLINTRRGSYFFLGEIVTNVPLTPDDPAVGGCGTCTRCLDACPTNAFVAPFILDSRRCISYLTIELKGAISEEFIPAMGAAGNRVYGCDICQEACPFNADRGDLTPPAPFPRREGEEYNLLSPSPLPRSTQGEVKRKERGRGGVRGSAEGAKFDGAPGAGETDTGEGAAALPPLPKSSTALDTRRGEAERAWERLGEGDAGSNRPSNEIHGASPTTEPAFQPRPFLKDLKDVKDLLYLTQEQFSAAFKGSPVKRAKRRGLLRNTAAALSSRDDDEAIAALRHALEDPEELVRDQAERSLKQIEKRRSG